MNTLVHTHTHMAWAKQQNTNEANSFGEYVLGWTNVFILSDRFRTLYDAHYTVHGLAFVWFAFIIVSLLSFFVSFPSSVFIFTYSLIHLPALLTQ